MCPRKAASSLQPPAWLTELGIPVNCISSQTAVGDERAKFRIKKAVGDEVWCMQVDGGWLTGAQKKVDFLFYCSSAAGKRKIILVELKGQHLSDALAQIRSTLAQLCKLGVDEGIHSGRHRNAPGHEAAQSGGIRAYVILSKYRSTSLDQIEMKNIARQFRVVVTPKSQLLAVQGIERLP